MSGDRADQAAGGGPGAYDHRHHPRPSPAEFLSRHLGASHPLFSPDTPLSQIDASAYQVDGPTTNALMRSVWSSLLAALPSPAHILPVRAAQLPTIEATLDFLEQHSWKLSEAQKAAVKLAEQAHDKGKGKAGAGGSDARRLDAKRMQLGPEYGPDRKGMPCGHIFKKGEAIYRCRDCAHDDTCVQCAPCFNASDHEGHDIVFSVSSDSGGCCDCGDEEAWKQPLGCTYHETDRNAQPAESGSASAARTDRTQREDSMELDDAMAPSQASSASKGKGRAVDTGMSHTSSSSSKAPVSEISDILRAVPDQLRLALEDHIGSILDYVLDTLEHAPESASLPKTGAIAQIKSAATLMPESRTREATTRASGAGSTADTSTERMSFDSETDFFSQIDPISPMPGSWTDSLRSGRSGGADDPDNPYFDIGRDGLEATTPRPGAPRRDTIVARGTSRSKRKQDEEGDRYYTLLLWNDEKHDFTQVIDIVMDVTGRSMLAAKSVAERVDKHGREIIEVHRDVTKLFMWGLKLNSIDLAVSIRPSYDVFAEEIAGLLVKHLLDLASSVLYVTDAKAAPADADETQTHPLDKLTPSAAQMRAIVTHALLEPWDHTKPIYAESMSAAFFSGSDLRRLDGLLLLESKLWKELRGNVKETFMACIGVKETRKEIAFRFAHMYSKVVETFILRDREPEHSICFMTVQLFSVPSIASSLVSDIGFLETLLQILQAIFTSSSGTDPLTLPPSPPTKGQANPASPLFKLQRCYHIFYDVRYLLGADGVQRQLVSKHSHLNYFLDFLSLFNAINPDKRAVDQHVEYESEIWIPVFHVSSHLGRAAKLFGEAFAKATPAQLTAALGQTARRILLSCLTLHQNDPEVHAPVVFQNTEFGGRTFQTIQFDVARQAVSFHHPMHWLLAEMLKHTAVLSSASMASLGKSGLAELLQTDVDENGVLVLLDFPLRVTVKLAQVRSGMWVRNGYALRSQAHHYRENPMRDIMYDQDLFLLQCGFSLASPERWLVSMIDRFGLTKFFENGEVAGEHTHLMADELILLLVHLLTEVAIVAGWPMEKQIQREIVHFLALGSGTYSEITKHVSERFTDHHAFERVLGQVSTFRAPDGVTDLGIFELRDDKYDEVRPYFMHYTRNQREKAQEVLLERHKKRGGKEDTAAFWAARKPDLSNEGPYPTDRMHAVLLTDAFRQLICAALLNCQVEGDDDEVPESLLESTLHLVSVALAVKEAAFAQKMLDSAIDPKTAAPVSAIAILCKFETDERMSAVKGKVAWLLERASKLVQNSGDAAALARLNAIFQDVGKAPMSTDEQAAEKARMEAKRAAAKARQAAIMQKFSAQQKDLLKTFEDEVTDSEDDDRMEDPTEARDARQSFGTCILCQDDLDPSKPFGMLAHIQPSRVMRTMPCGDANAIAQAVSTPLSLDRGAGEGESRLRGMNLSAQGSDETGRPAGAFPPSYNKPALHTTSCGHMMHAACFWEYCRSVEQRHALQIAREHPEDLSRCEYVCPLCKALGNVILPLRDSHRCDAVAAIGIAPLDTTPLPDWIRRINIDILKWSTAKSPMCQEPEVGTGTFLPWYTEDAFASLHARERNMADLDVDTFHMLDRILTVLRLISSELKPLRAKMQQRTILALPSRKLYIPQDVIGHTLAMIEVSQRGQPPAKGAQPSLIGTVSESTFHLISSLVHCLRITLTTEYGGPGAEGGVKAAELIRQGLLKRLLPHWAGDEAVRSPLLLRDPLSLLVETAAVMPEGLDQVITLMYYVDLVQLVFGLAQPSMWAQSAGNLAGSRAAFATTKATAEQLDADLETAKTVFPDVRWTTANIVGLVGYARGNITLGIDHLDDDILGKLLCTHSLPFLRRAALLRAAVHGPSAIPAADSKQSEYLRLMQQLKIPLPSIALPARAEKQTYLAGLIEGWIKHAYAPLASLFRPLPINYSSINANGGFGIPQSLAAPVHPTLLLEHPHIYELIDLPHDLATLLQETQQRVCQRCKEVPTDPALCLLCGEIVCFQSFCCQSEDGKRGECNRHMDDCGGAVGIYFKVKTNVILLLFEQTGTFLFSPYLDSHGEVDIGLRKGRPQKLHRQRYDELRKQWLQHGVSNLVARKIEASMDNGGWGTM